MPRLAPTRAPSTLQAAWQGEVGGYVQGLRWSPDGRQLAAAAIEGPITLFDGTSGAAHLTLPGHAVGTATIDWNASAALLASGGQDGKIRVWDIASGSERLVLDGGAPWVERVAWSPTGGFLASAAGRKARLWDGNGLLLRDWDDHASTVADLAWKPGGKELATTAYGGLTLWRSSSATPLRRYEWQGSTLVIAWSPNGELIATGDQDSTVHFWYVKSGRDLQMWGYATKVRELAWSPSSRYLATGGGRNITVWDCAGAKGPADSRPLELIAHELPLTALAWQRQGPLLASGGQDGLLALWNTAKSKRAAAAVQLGANVAQLAWSPDDRQLAVGCDDGAVLVYTPA